MKCSCGHILPDPVIDLLGEHATPPLVCDRCGNVHRFTIPTADDILLTQFMSLADAQNMANNVQKPFGDRSPCPVCDEMMPSPVINDGKSTTTSCGNCGTRRTIQVSDPGDEVSKPVPPDGKLWN